jgi:hypothetical protein
MLPRNSIARMTGLRNKARVFIACVIGGSLSAFNPSAAQQIRPEYELKAAFLLKFAQFAQWPPSAFSGRKTFELCVVSPNPFGDSLQALAISEPVMGLPVAVRVATDVPAIDTCHVLFVPTRAGGRKPLLDRARTLPILTVGEDGAFLDDGGVINLRVVDGRMRFDVHAAAAQRAGLRLSSQLIRLAVTVREDGP